MVTDKSKYYYFGDNGATNPGQGRHCMYPDLSFPKGTYKATGSHSCVMHHNALGLREFCPECCNWLRYNRLTSGDTNWEPGESFWGQLRGALWGRRGAKAG